MVSVRKHRYYKMTGSFHLSHGAKLVYNCIVKIVNNCPIDFSYKIVAGEVTLDDQPYNRVGATCLMTFDSVLYRNISLEELDTNTCKTLYD